MSFIDGIINNLPEVQGPTQKKLSFKEKLKWSGIILVLFFILGMVPLFGLGEHQLQQFEQLAIILGASFGSIISLGIGPIVTASIVLQLLNGSGIIKFDLTTTEGKKRFQGTQKLLAVFFIIFEAAIYVFMGGLPPAVVSTHPNFFTIQLIIIFQLILGGILILFMDEVISKWGFGSGISLFIAGGVSQSIFIRALNPLPAPGDIGGIPSGAIPGMFVALTKNDPLTAGLFFASILATLIVFALSVYGQSMKIEIPLSFGRVRGHGIRWPLKFMYTSVIPVILIAALLANIQLWARLLQNWGYPLLGTFSVNGVPETGFITMLNAPNIFRSLITGVDINILNILVYVGLMVGGSIIFSIFWVQTSGMDARSHAKQIMASGLQVPGFRKDQRVLEQILNRYISSLTIMGGALVGLLAASADLLGALERGTGILLAVMIIYNLYEEIAKHHMMDMNPMMRKFMGK